ncbi:MAG: SGNH/GDSL hydrolase family protein [Crocinitomicaceae bacterium]
MKYLVQIFTLTILFACTEKVQIFQEKDPVIHNLSYLALGDSYTIGESVSESERWPNQLESRLINDSTGISTEIIAKTGWRTDNLLSAAEDQLTDEKFDIVSLLIGVNNEFQGEDPNDFEQKFRTCLNFAIKHSKKGKDGVFIVSIPDYGYTPYGQSNQKSISERLAQYNAICKSVAETEGILFIDITPISQNGLIQPELVASDGLHPSGTQYGLWADLMVEPLRRLME